MAYCTRNTLVAIAAVVALASPAFAQTEQRSSLNEGQSTHRSAGATEAFIDTPRDVDAADIDSTIFYEDFRDGLAGWTVVNTEPDSVEGWVYTLNDSLHQFSGLGRGSFLPMRSPTYENGFAYFRYTQIASDSGRVNVAGPPYPRLVGSLISPYFSTSGAAGQKLALYWYQFARTLNIVEHTVQFQVKGDEPGGFIDVNRVRNASRVVAANQYIDIPPGFVGRDSVRFIINYDGDYYGWAIDDIYVSALPPVDVKLDASFIAGAPNAVTPVSQTEGQTLYFVTDLEQLGADSVETKLAITIQKLGTTNEMIYTDTLDYGKIFPDSLFENMPFPEGFPMPTEVGNYRGTYRVVPFGDEADFNNANNTASFNFSVGTTLYAKGRTSTGNRFYSQDFRTEQRIGNLYRTPNNTAEEPVIIDSIQLAMGLTGLSDDSDFTSIQVNTYGWRGDLDKNGDFTIGLESDETAELVLLGQNFLEFDEGTPDFDTLAILAPDEAAGAVTLPTDQGYIGFGLEMFYQQTTAPGTIANIFEWGSDANFAYGGRSVASVRFDSIRNRSSFLSLGVEGATFRGYDGTGTPFFINAILKDNTVSIEETLTESAFRISPNPANTHIAVDFDFGDNAQMVQFDIINAVGQRVDGFKHQVSSAGRFSVDITGLNVGLYFVTATTDSGQTGTRRVLIQR